MLRIDNLRRMRLTFLVLWRRFRRGVVIRELLRLWEQVEGSSVQRKIQLNFGFICVSDDVGRSSGRRRGHADLSVNG